jgi:uncharacterized repeat protein (TIGR01451 family)
MRNLSVVLVAAPLALAACAGSDNDYDVLQPGGADAGVDGSSRDARPADAAPDASPNVADLAIELAGTPDPVAASSTLTYTIDVTNHGGLDAEDIVVTQRLPAGNVAFVSAAGIGWSCNAAGQLVTCTRATLLVGPGPSISVRVTTPPTGGAITTSAEVASDTPDPVTANDDAELSTMVLTPADLAIAIADSPDPVAAGGTLSYAITVSNAGPGGATGITVLDTLPGGVGFVSASGAGWSCSAVDQTVSCVSAALAAASSSTITLVVTAPPSGGTVSNTAQVSAATPDGNTANNQATTGTTVNAAADLSIAMVDSPDPVLGSGQLRYSIDVTNLGPNTASGVAVTNSLPAGNVTFVSAAGSGWTCLPSGQQVACTRPSLLVGAAPTITITVQAPSESAILSDTATVTSTSSDLEPANNTAMVLTQVLSAADLSVATVDSPDPVTTTGTLSYTVTASNAGPSQAAEVSVTTQLPAGAAFQSASGINWECNVVGQQVTCTTQQLVSGTAPAITIVASAPGVDGSITATSSISSETTDPVPANNTASQVTVVNAPSDLALALSASPSPVPAASTLTYTIGVTNLGPRDATNLVVTDRLPDGDVLFLGASGIGWTCALAGQIVTCTRPLLLVGAAPSITIQIKTPDVAGTLIDTASVSASTADLDLANNAATDTTGVFDSADLSIIASDSPDPVRIGTEVTYTLSVANSGPTAATEISVVDTLPVGTTFVSASGAGWACGNLGRVVTCTMASLGIASSAPAISIVAIAPDAAGTIANTATVGSSTFDPATANNATTITTLANLFADLSVALTDDPDPVQGSPQQGCSANDCTTYTIVVDNVGPDTATDVKVVIALPLNGLFHEAVGDGWVCPAPVGGTITCTRLATVAIETAPPISLTWKAPSPGGFSIVVTPTVSGSSTDPDATDNTAIEATTVRP